MLKGRTKIELTNVHTGKKEEYIHDNMITNAVSDMLSGDGVSLPRASCEAFSNYNTIADDLFGGVMLWQEQLSPEASDYMLPLTNTCIGYATRDFENTTSKNLKLGSFNANESSETLKEFKYVWDFTTSQANGQISAVSLVPKIMGQLEADTPISQLDSSKLYTTNKNYKCTELSYAVTNEDDISYRTLSGMVVGIHNNIRYELYGPNLFLETGYEDKYIKNNGKKLTLIKRKFSNSQITIGQSCTKIVDCHALDISEVESVDIQLPSSYDVSSPGQYGVCVMNYPYLYFYTTSENKNKTISLAKINVTDNSVEIISIPDFPCIQVLMRLVANSVVSNKKNYFYSLYNCIPTILDKYLITIGSFNVIRDTGYPIYYWDLTNIELGKREVKEKIDNSEIVINFPYNNFGGNLVGLTVKDKFFLCNIRERSSSGNYSDALIYAKDNELFASRLNSNILSSSSYYTYLFREGGGTERSPLVLPLITPNNRNYCVLAGSENNIYGYMKGSIMYTTNPFFLSTKNNLEAPVTKTSEQTMKVTYTITEV